MAPGICLAQLELSKFVCFYIKEWGQGQGDIFLGREINVEKLAVGRQAVERKQLRLLKRLKGVGGVGHKSFMAVLIKTAFINNEKLMV